MSKTAKIDVFKHRIALFVVWMLPIPIVIVVAVLFSRSIKSLQTDNRLLVTNIAENISGSLENITEQFLTLSGLFAGRPLLVEYSREDFLQRPETQIVELQDGYLEELNLSGVRAPGGGSSLSWFPFESGVFPTVPSIPAIPAQESRTPERFKIIAAARQSFNRVTGDSAAHYLVIPESEIHAKYSGLAHHLGPVILILDKDNRILSSSDPCLSQQFGTVFEQDMCGKAVVMSSARSGYTGWQTVIMMPAKTFAAPMTTLYRNLIIAIVIIILIVAAVSFVVNYHLVKKEKHNRDLEIKVLMGQINPHVVYNSLETIVWKANQAKLREIAVIASQIGKLLRLSVSSGETMRTLEQVIHHLKIYVDVEKIRYKEKLEFEILPFPDAFLAYKVPPLLLQPCVENAVMHGMKPGASVLHIKLSVEQQDGVLYFRVEDNGSGIKPERLEKIRKGQYFETRGSRIGIKNIQERLKIFFGKDYGLTVESEEGVGTTVTVKVPVLV
jgi:hypothetical protein